MKIFLEEDAVGYAYYDNYPIISFGISSNDIIEELEQRRKAKGFPLFFDDTTENYWGDGWYNIYVEVDSELKTVVKVWADVISNTDKKTVPDTNVSYEIRFNSEELIGQIEEQLKERFGTSLENLRAETEAEL